MKYRFTLLSLSCLLILEVNGQELLTVDDCRQLAIENNARVKIANNQVRGSEENTKAKSRDFYPVISGDGSYKFLVDPVSIELDGTRFTGTEHIYNIGVTVQQNVYSGGRTQFTSDNAKLEENIAGDNLELTTDQLLFRTEMAYWKAVWSMEAFNIANQYKGLLDELVTVISDKVETGLVPRNDQLMAEVRQNEAELLIYKSRTMHEVSLMELNRIIGNDITRDITVESDIMYADYALPALPSTDQVLLERPEISIRKNMIGISENNVNLTKSNYAPQILLNFRPIWGAPNTDLMDSDPIFNAAAYASIYMPLVQWGKKRYEVGAQKFNYESSLLELEDLQDQIALEVSSAYYQLRESIERITLTEASLAKAQENYELIEDRYLEGLSPIIELLDAQYSWLLAYNAVLDSRLNYLIVLSEYKRVIGQI